MFQPLGFVAQLAGRHSRGHHGTHVIQHVSDNSTRISHQTDFSLAL